MKRALAVLTMAGATTALLATPASARPISEPASCQGYLASYANPNFAFILEELVWPEVEATGTNVGHLIVPAAQSHEGGLEACIPD